MPNPRELAEQLASLCERLITERRRLYGAPWSDWPAGNTGCNTHPVIYALWPAFDAVQPLYVGKTESLGPRLGVHFNIEGWSQPPTHVSFVEDHALNDPAMLFALEKFATAALVPTDNDLRH